MSALDSVIALRIVGLLVAPFEQWDAFKLSIIDKDGKLLITDPSKFNEYQHNAWTMLHRLVWRLKLIINKVPMGKSQFASMAAAYLLIKEHYDHIHEIKNLHDGLKEAYHKVSDIEIRLFGDACANSVAAGGVDMTANQEKSILNKKKMVRRFKEYRASVK